MYLRNMNLIIIYETRLYPTYVIERRIFDNNRPRRRKFNVIHNAEFFADVKFFDFRHQSRQIFSRHFERFYYSQSEFFGFDAQDLLLAAEGVRQFDLDVTFAYQIRSYKEIGGDLVGVLQMGGVV